ncbi:MAG: dihydrofolate reductase [Candidatus Kerfeldbacteria bacterium]|nr:dihydrofolate reductase [Candidatus Kerfeldbacteria bacterium]
MEFSIIAAQDRNRGIGKAGKLPWAFRGDMEHFKAITTREVAPGTRNAVIMGSTTWNSLPEKHRPLSDRLNVVLSFTPLDLPPGVLSATSLEDAFSQLALQSVGEVFIIGGASVYAQAIKHPACRKLYLTEIDAVFDCDTFFPDLPAGFVKVSQAEPVTERGISYRYAEYKHQS